MDVAELVEHVADELRGRGERMTAPRRAVLEVLHGRTEHLTADEVLAEVAGVDPSVHRASVYRSLETLCDLGVVQHIHLGHGGTTYHLVEDGHEHLHAQCRRCGRVVDLPVDLLDEVAVRVADLSGFSLDPTHVALSGTCRECVAPSRPT